MRDGEMLAYRGRAGRVLHRYLLDLWLGAEEAYRARILEVVGRAQPEALLDLGCDDGS